MKTQETYSDMTVRKKAKECVLSLTLILLIILIKIAKFDK